MANRFRHIEEPVFVEETELLSPEQQAATASPENGNGDSSSAATPEDESTKKKKKRSWQRRLLGGEILVTRRALRQIPLVLLILVLCIIAVSNRYTVESLRKEILKTQKEIDELSLQQIQLKSQYQQSIKISTIANSLDSLGVKLVTEPPLTLHRK